MVTIIVLMFLGNVVFHSQRGIPYRALDPQSPLCNQTDEGRWTVLTKSVDNQIMNDEWSAIDTHGADWRSKLSCSIQRHTLAGYQTGDGAAHSLDYDLAFLEFQEDGKPYALRVSCTTSNDGCVDEGYGPVRKERRSQLQAILDSLASPTPHYVIVFIHGWRHDASVGDTNVAEFREYAAYAARFIEDRWVGKTTPKPRVTAIFVGWRGARTDETWLKRHFGKVGEWVGSFSAIFTLFDRKPVSEAIAPSVLSGLRAIEHQLDLQKPLPPGASAPPAHVNRMIVFGHSLGGNMLATALQEDLVKKVSRHTPGTNMLPVLGDLVVLINPASEASKWIAVQRAVWSKTAQGFGERRSGDDYVASHLFFPRNQAPIVVSVTAARDWPPGGRTELDCFSPDATELKKEKESAAVITEGFQYDWATYDMFPAFKGDPRPVADTIERLALGSDPHDACDHTKVSWMHRAIAAPAVGLGAMLRVFPFAQTDPQETRTIGNLDPPRSPRSSINHDYVTGLPFGTTHELRGLAPEQARTKRQTAPNKAGLIAEIPLPYEKILGPEAACPVSMSWLLIARNESERRDREASSGENHGMFWDSALAGDNAPSLEFRHGFLKAGVAPITRANDPFWNMRAFDSALARHDGYMLASFVCAMNQLVLDDITAPPPDSAHSSP